MKTRLTSLLLAMVMLISVLPIGALAAEIASVESDPAELTQSVEYTEPAEGLETEDAPAEFAECNHNYQTVVTAPTCTAQGYSTHTCTICGNSYRDNYVAATAHNYRTSVITPTCTKDGYTTYTCSACGDSYTADHTNALGHNYIKGVCSRCGAETAYAEAVTVKTSNDAATGKIKLSWSAADGAAQYRVYRSSSKNGSYSTLTTTEKTSYLDSSAKAGSRYYYYVVSITDNGTTSAKSNVVNRLCDCARPVVTTSNDAATGKIKLSWKAVDGAEKYQVYRCKTKNGDYTLMKTVTTTTYLNKNAQAGTLYYYKVKAIASDSNANSAFSEVKSRTCDYERPVVEVAEVTSSSIKISWEKVQGATGYIVYRATSENGEYTKLKSVTALYCTDKTAKAGPTYYYKVVTRAENSNANSAKSAAVSAKISLSAPTIKTTASATASTIKISWNKLDHADGYFVYRRTSTSNSWSRIKIITNADTTTFTNKDVSGRYYYCVAGFTSVDGTRYAGTKSSSIRSRTLGKTAAVATPWDDELKNTISWNKVTGATGYQIYFQTSKNSTWKRAATVGDVTSYTHTVNHGIYYTYKVRPIYKYNGATTYGPYGALSESWIQYYNPNYSTAMLSDSYSSTNYTLIYVENHGLATMRFYSEGGVWLDGTNSYYDRDAVLCDYDAAMNDNTLVEVSYVDVAPGTSTYLVIGLRSATRYNTDTVIGLYMDYDGISYYTETSYYGSNYYNPELDS